MKSQFVFLLTLLVGGSVCHSGTPAEVSSREVFWGTPNFSYAADTFTPEVLRASGVTYMSHLIYWNKWETAPGHWDDGYMNHTVALIDALHSQGIVSGVRLGEGHPGSQVWHQEDGHPYAGRNPGCYPGNADSDQRYFEYLTRLAHTLRGKVDHYILGDELDMIFGASFRDEARLREYAGFFVKASQVIKSQDPDVKVVVFPFAWGKTVENAQLLIRLGIGQSVDGFCLNIAHGDCVNSKYLSGIAAGIENLSPKYGLYSNGFGYLSDSMTEDGQAASLAHTMFVIWRAGWTFLPYYTMASNEHPWSSGLFRENLADGGVTRRLAAGVFQRASEVLGRKPRVEQEKVRVVAFETPFGVIDPKEFSAANVNAIWQSDGDNSFGAFTFETAGDPRVLRTRIELPNGPEGTTLELENIVTGNKSELPYQLDQNTGRVVATIEVRSELQIVRWVKKE